MSLRPLFLALPLLATACWKPSAELSELTFDEVPYDSVYVTEPDIVISAYDTTLDCPTGEKARFFAAYQKGKAEASPIAIVLHSGAFDYVVEPDPTNVLAGRHYHGISRLDRGWAISKVWETLGLYFDEVDPYEVNDGALTATLVNQGFMVLLPGNCWGDLWHNEQGYVDNQVDVEGFDRNGRTFGYWMIRIVFESQFASNQDFSAPVPIDSSQIYLIGLGDGGRGVAEVLSHDNLPNIAGVLIDSSPDDLSPYLDEPMIWADEIAGMSRIFREENLDTLSQYSLASLVETGQLPDRVGYIWSDGDPRQPAATMSGTASVLNQVPGYWVSNRREPAHVYLNGDADLADAAVDYLVTGIIPED